VEEAWIEPGTAALQSGSPSRLSQLSHHIPNFIITHMTGI
jgi:hypothetical protein